MQEYRFVYLFLCIVAFLVWAIAFTLRKDLRKEMLIMSGIVGFFGITQFLYVGEYWTPTYVFPIFGGLIGVEDFLLASFFYGGVGSVLYLYLINRRFICTPHSRTLKSMAICGISLVAGILAYLVLTYGTSINIIYTTTIALLVPVVVLVIFHPSFFRLAFTNGLLMGLLAVGILAATNALFPGYIESTWNLSVLSGLLWAGVPIEEFLFHFAAGGSFAVGYECLFNCRIAYTRKN